MGKMRRMESTVRFLYLAVYNPNGSDRKPETEANMSTAKLFIASTFNSGRIGGVDMMIHTMILLARM